LQANENVGAALAYLVADGLRSLQAGTMVHIMLDTTLEIERKTLQIRLQNSHFDVHVTVPSDAVGVVIFAGDAASLESTAANVSVAEMLSESGFATVLADSGVEEELNFHTGELCAGVELQGSRVVAITDWARMQEELRGLPMAYFGAGAGAESALIAAGKRPEVIRAVVSCGAQLSRLGNSLRALAAPVLFVTGGEDMDFVVNEMSRLRLLPASTVREWQVIGRRTDPLEEPEMAESVAVAARSWFEGHLGTAR
jgi:putative phosphoribosyl transferase